MLSQTRVIDWRGHHFRFERMEPPPRPRRSEIDWAVSHAGEFIGTMRSPPGEPALDFELRAFHWLRDLLSPKGLAIGTAAISS
jgi:hypothetical protein